MKRITKKMIEEHEKNEKIIKLNKYMLKHIEVLRYTCEGMTAGEISAKTSESIRSVEGYIYKMMKLSGARNKVQLAVLP